MSNPNLDPIISADGSEVLSENFIAEALAPEKVTITFNGFTLMTWVRKSQVSVRQQMCLQSIVSKIAIKAGYHEGDKIGGAVDERALRFVELLNESQSYLEASAEIAVAATVLQPDGKPATNVPQITALKKFTPEELLSTGAIGEAYIAAVTEALRPTSPAEDGVEVPPKTKKASTTKS